MTRTIPALDFNEVSIKRALSLNGACYRLRCH